MEWSRESIVQLEMIIGMKEKNTDRRNFSVIWNKYLTIYGATVLGIHRKDVKHTVPSVALFNNLLNLINYNNEMVADSVIIDNPDRLGQYILLKREMAEKILLLGMI